MKRTRKLISIVSLLTAVILGVSCHKEDQANQDNTILLDELPNDAFLKYDAGLLSKVQVHLDETNSGGIAAEIQDVKYYKTDDSKIYFISYQLDDGSSSSVVIRDNFVKNEGITISCIGDDCDCHIEGRIDMDGDDTWSQCSCDGCQMQVTSHPIEKQSNELLEKRFIDLAELAKQSYTRTFGETNTIVSIKQIEYQKFEKSNIQIFTYEGENNIESTFMIVTALVDGANVNGIEMQARDRTVIDCTGSCDCRERFYPETGAAECTCSDCEMIVESVPTTN